MGILNTRKRKVQGIGALLLALLVLAGCAGIEPYEPRNNREEGPESGL
jgi:PBP1b-binding outer membrane lipoprotein LpoB